MLPREGQVKGVHHPKPLLYEMLKGFTKEKKIENMNTKMTMNSQLSTTEPKTNKRQKQTKQTTRTGTESQKWRSHGSLSVGEGQGREWRKRYQE